MMNANLLVVSSIKDAGNNSVGYRVVDIMTKEVKDITLSSLEEGVRIVANKFINVRVNLFGNGLRFATPSQTDRELPAITLTGKRLITSDAYTVGYSDTRGNVIAFNAHGQRVVVQPREYLSGIKTFTNAYLQNGKLIGNFISHRLDKDYFIENKVNPPKVFGMIMTS